MIDICYKKTNYNQLFIRKNYKEKNNITYFILLFIEKKFLNNEFLIRPRG